jgi:DNA-directed RNA polymerase
MEYKRFYEFYIDENASKFLTYLPIQLDATCNGFQHMALLSNEDTLFKELNLVCNNEDKSDKNDVTPSDFYNFLLHKLINLFKSKVDSGETMDGKGSYTRLLNFI